MIPLLMTTPMMQQWESCKGRAQGALLLFRLGDFYEAFHHDAELIAKELSLTLTARQGVPMCGVPAHTADSYIDKLVAKGFRVAIAEQTESDAKGLMRREVVRVVSPGALVQSGLLQDKANNYIASLCNIGKVVGVSLLDVSTGEMRAAESDVASEVIDELCRLRPAEILIPKRWSQEQNPLLTELRSYFPFATVEKEEWHYDPKGALVLLLSHFQMASLDAFGLQGKLSATGAAGALFKHLKEEMALSLAHVTAIATEPLSAYLAIDRSTLRHLELFANRDGTKSGSLLHLLDVTSTPMGARLLAQWLLHPLLSVEEIGRRQEAIGELQGLVTRLTAALEPVRDVERLRMRLSAKIATPRDVAALGRSLKQIPEIREALRSAHSPLLRELLTLLAPLPDLVEKISKTLVDTPPVKIGEGEMIRAGVSSELDELKALASDSLSWIARYQTVLREETGIKTLKVGYTKAFGYFIETSRAQADKIPPSFQRRQTLVNGERFITDELKLFESKVLSAEERSRLLEAHLFDELRAEAARHLEEIGKNGKAIAQLDALLSLAFVAREQKWVKPIVDRSDALEITAGRHPVVEAAIGASQFIPNDCLLNGKERLMLITGPNMAGKSTYIRQTALLVLLAQTGSFVPARAMRLGVVDKLFSRIGASDDLSRGQSTFMVEMSETAYILHHATDRSLVLLDEIGRGTSTYDGISIAWAVAEFLLTTPGKRAKTLFATHYWELTRLEQQVAGAVNYQVAVSETQGGIVFLRKIVRGGTDKSYGIHVAKLAGLPPQAIRRAEAMLAQLEQRSLSKQPPTPPHSVAQLSLFGPPVESL
jgi:DNA mismatch repair protein MutS